MNGAMFMILAVCGVWMVLGKTEVADGWRETAKFAGKVVGLYVAFLAILVCLYYGVVLRWLVF